MKDASWKVEGSPLTLALSPEYRGEGIIRRWSTCSVPRKNQRAEKPIRCPALEPALQFHREVIELEISAGQDRFDRFANASA